MHDVEQENMLDHKEQDMHCFDTELTSVLPLSTVTTATVNSDQDTIMMEKPPSTPTQPAKCRLPVPAFAVDKSVSASMPVKEKIANVIRKRQSISDANRSQGSRIPMLCSSILQPVIEHLKDPEELMHTPRLRSVKSVRLQSPVQKKSVSGGDSSLIRKPLTRSNTVPLRMDQVLKPPQRQIKPPSATVSTAEKLSHKRASQRSPLSELKTNTRKPKINTSPTTAASKPKRELPPKSSIYRKRLPAGESRTARLMMGVSTNGRRQSFRQRDEMAAEKDVSPTLGHRFGKLFGSHKLKEPPTSPTLATKKRPMSFAASSSSLHMQPPPLPPYRSIPSIPPLASDTSKSNRLKRQSVPVAPKALDEDRHKRTNKKANNSSSSSSNSSNTTNNNSSSNKDNGHSLKNSIKALRVH